MKKIILLFAASLFIATFLISNQIKAQPACAWAKKAGSTNEDWGSSVATDNSGNVYYLGNFYSATIVFGTTTLHNQAAPFLNYGAEMFLVKYDSCGNFKWAKQAGGNNDTWGRRLVADAAGNVYVAGFSNCDTLYFGAIKLVNKAGYYFAFVTKYDSNGNALWAQEGSGYNNTARANAIALDATGNVYVTGNFAASSIKFGNDSIKNEFDNGDAYVFIAKFDNSGNIQWVRGGGGDYAAYGYGIGSDASGNVYVTGTFGSSHIRFGNDSLPLSPSGYYDIYVVKYNTSGTEQWLRTAGSGDDDEAMGLASDASGNVYITGNIGVNSTVSFGTHSITNNTQSLEPFITKYNSSGTDQWAKGSVMDNYSNGEGYNVTLDANGNPYIIGFFSSDLLIIGPDTLYNNSLLGGGGDTLYDIFVAKYKSNGILSWARSAGGNSNDFGYGIATGGNASVYITGEFVSDTISFAGIKLTRTTASLAGDGDAFIANNISTNSIVPTICMVTVDTVLAQNNIITWDKTPYVNLADSFKIYREISTNNYQPIGTVPYSATSLFIDTVRVKYAPNTGNPNAGTYRYKIALRDTSGNLSMMSPYHNTIYVVNNAGTFNWNPYNIENSANPVNTYVLMRDDNSTGNFHSVVSVAGTQQSVTDPSYANYQTTAAWRVETNWNISCTPTIIKNDPQLLSISLNSSRSNVYRTIGAGIHEYGKELQVQISPNPSNGVFQVQCTTANGSTSTVEVCNVLGEKVYSSSMNNERLTINLSDANSGVYFLTVKTENGIAVKKIIKE